VLRVGCCVCGGLYGGVPNFFVGLSKVAILRERDWCKFQLVAVKSKYLWSDGTGAVRLRVVRVRIACVMFVSRYGDPMNKSSLF